MGQGVLALLVIYAVSFGKDTDLAYSFSGFFKGYQVGLEQRQLNIKQSKEISNHEFLMGCRLSQTN